jgi:hypothetical protein
LVVKKFGLNQRSAVRRKWPNTSYDYCHKSVHRIGRRRGIGRLPSCIATSWRAPRFIGCGSAGRCILRGIAARGCCTAVPLRTCSCWGAAAVLLTGRCAATGCGRLRGTVVRRIMIFSFYGPCRRSSFLAWSFYMPCLRPSSLACAWMEQMHRISLYPPWKSSSV